MQFGFFVFLVDWIQGLFVYSLSWLALNKLTPKQLNFSRPMSERSKDNPYLTAQKFKSPLMGIFINESNA
jgi:hypothetical protein